MEAGQQSEKGVSMGSAAVIFVLLVVIVGMAIGWRSTVSKTLRETGLLYDRIHAGLAYLQDEKTRNTQLEAEIQRLRKIPLTQPPEKVDNSTIKAKSSADVRRLTEAAFGLQPEIGAQNDIE
jgi:hypothetical protein